MNRRKRTKRYNSLILLFFKFFDICIVSPRPSPNATNVFNNFYYHRCRLGVTSLLLMQRVRVRSPVGSISWFPSFASIIRQMSGNLGHIRPWLSYGHCIPSKPIFIPLRTATISDHSYSTWPSLNKEEQQFLYFY